MKPNTKAEKIKKLDLKPKKTRIYSRGRNSFTNCPICNSRLFINKNRTFECSGDFLLTLEADFIVYDKLDEINKLIMLENYSNYNEFTTLYKQWKTSKLLGVKFECEFNLKTNYTSSNYQTLIPDPIIVTRKERELKRGLTEEELELLPKINFPEDV